MSKKLNGGFEKEPTIAYYQYKAPEDAHPKVRVLKKGQVIIAYYEHTFVDGMYQTHLLKTAEGNVTVKGCSSINATLQSLDRGYPVKLTYLGNGKAQPGKMAPFKWDIHDLEPEELATLPVKGAAPKAKAAKPAAKRAPEPQADDSSDDSSDDSDDDEIPF